MDLRKLEVKLSNESNKAERYRELRNQVDLKEREIKMLQQRLAACTHGQILEQINSLETTKGNRIHGCSLYYITEKVIFNPC